MWIFHAALAQDVGIYIIHRRAHIPQRAHCLGMFIIKGHCIAGRKGIRWRAACTGICVFSHLCRHVRAQRKNRMRGKYSAIGGSAYILPGQIGQILITTIKARLHAKVGHPLLPQLTGMRIQQLAQLVNRHRARINLLANDIGKGRHRVDIGNLHALPAQLYQLFKPDGSKISISVLCGAGCAYQSNLQSDAASPSPGRCKFYPVDMPIQVGARHFLRD